MAAFGLVTIAGRILDSEAASKPVSYAEDVVPILKRSCTGCHHPGKLKGDLDLTTFAALYRGGKHGATIQPGEPGKSRLLEEISGDEPSMPKEGDPLSKAEVALFERWILEGARDDTPLSAAKFTDKEPPTYSVPPVLSALTYSPDGKVLAVSGYHEVLLHSGDGTELLARLIGDSPRIESLAFSPDGKRLAVSGGAPAQFGEIQVWEIASRRRLGAYRVTSDCVYGVSFSPEADRIAFGCADKSVRMLRVQDGLETLRFDNHSDWVLGTTFTVDGKRLLSGSRDRAMKLIDPSNGQLIDDVNKLIEGVLCFARHPQLDQILYGGDMGGVRIYRMQENQQRTAANNDVNMVREFERQPGPVRAVAYAPTGDRVAVAGAYPEVRIYKTNDGSRSATLTGHEGAIFTVAFQPISNRLATGGYDGNVRIYDAESGKLLSRLIPVPIKPNAQVASKRP